MRRRPSRKPPVDRKAAEEWMHAARGKPCAACGRRAGVVIRGHHVIDQQSLRRLCADAGLDYELWRWDQRNLLPLCDACHERHHSRAAVLPLALVARWAPEALPFAEDIDSVFLDGREPASMYLEREYA